MDRNPAPATAQPPADIPRPNAPASLEAAGLSESFVIELALKHLLRGGELTLAALGDRTALPLPLIEPILAFMRAERLVEVPRRGNFDADVAYVLTDLGRARTRDALEKSQYAGPAPVTLSDYARMVARQSTFDVRVSVSDMRRALTDLVATEQLADDVGTALNSGRSIYLYGPSGSGKTYMAEHMMRVLWGSVWIPHALVVEDQVIQMFDPVAHRPVVRTAERQGIDRNRPYDARWLEIDRPVVIAGGELTLDVLDLEFDTVTRFYNAPPQLKANNGMFILDDLGRQRVAARELMNRWIVPLDRRVDYLALHTGTKFQVPFDVRIVFSSNLAPAELSDPAFARRLGYKIYIGEMTEKDYRAVIRMACERAQIVYDDTAATHLIDRLHRPTGTPFLAAFPYDVIGKLKDRSRYEGIEPRLDPEQLDWAWRLYFAADRPVGTDSPAATEGRW